VLVVFGSNSFIGNNFVNYIIKKRLEFLSIGEYDPVFFNLNFIKTDYSEENLQEILDDKTISEIYMIKSLVRRDVIDRNLYKKKNIEIYNNLINFLGDKKIKKNITVHLFSIIEYEKNSEVNDLYLNTKIEQEFIVKSLLEKKNFSINIHRIPTVVGPMDLNFSRLTPSYLAHKLFNHEFEIINPNLEREFLSMDSFIKEFYSRKYDKKYEEHLYGNEKIVKMKISEYTYYLDSYFNYFAYGEQLDESASKLKNFFKFVNWYVENKDVVKKNYNAWMNYSEVS
tara:strand:- start:18265 stop:19113 length:849 start_codon:yes stop_codon:yes gene_type:complete